MARIPGPAGQPHVLGVHPDKPSLRMLSVDSPEVVLILLEEPARSPLRDAANTGSSLHE